MQKNSKWVFFLALAAMISGLIVLSFQMMRSNASSAATNVIAFDDSTKSTGQQEDDIVVGNDTEKPRKTSRKSRVLSGKEMSLPVLN